MNMDKTMKTEQIVEMLSKGMIEPKISVVGCGGAGNNIVNGIYWNCKSNIETIAVNTDEKKLEKVDAHKKILIGKDITHGEGAGGFPEVGEYCADCARPTLKEVLKGSDIVFVIAGMGGGTGTGAAPVVAEVAKELDAVTFAIAINPFSFERDNLKRASDGLKKLRGAAETTLVLDNDRLLEIAGDIPVRDSFAIMERSIVKIIESVCAKISESFITQIASDVEEMLHEIDEEESDEMAQIPAPEAELIHASIGEIGGVEFTTGLSPDFAAR
jgi:cell division protein FtsZ